MEQQELHLPERPVFDGVTYDADRDCARLKGQLGGVWTAMRDGTWRTLGAVSASTGYPEASISARLRDLRKARFGGHLVERRYVANGLFEYRVDAHACS